MSGTVAGSRAGDLETLRREVEDFITGEADLADSHDYDGWLGLWTRDAIYWVTANEDDYDPQSGHVSMIYDGFDKIDDRLFRLKGRRAYAQQPKSRLARVVSNIIIEPGKGPDEVVASAKFVIGEVRLKNQEIWIGRVRYTLRRVDGVLKMAEKKVMLLMSDAPMGNLTFVV